MLGQIIDWIYQTAIGFLGDFFMMMGEMGADLFELPWVEGIVTFFSYLGWSLYSVGIIIAVFELAIEAQHGRIDVRATVLNIFKGYLAVQLFTLVPVQLYQFCVSLQGQFTGDLSDIHVQIGHTAADVLNQLVHSSLSTNPIVGLFCVIMMGYAVIKIFFANLKRGGILVIQIAVGSLYMFSIPRGYTDGFVGWCKQIIGLCLTTFLQATVLIAGLLAINRHALLGLGLMLSATEIPRIAQQFGLETGTRANVMSAIYTTQSIVNLTRNVIKSIS